MCETALRAMQCKMQQAADTADANIKELRKNPKKKEKHIMRTPVMNVKTEQRLKNTGAMMTAVMRRKGDKVIRVAIASSVNATG